jgi:hypothetical protein
LGQCSEIIPNPGFWWCNERSKNSVARLKCTLVIPSSKIAELEKIADELLTKKNVIMVTGGGIDNTTKLPITGYTIFQNDKQKGNFCCL